MEMEQIKEMILMLLPHLNARIVKPVKHLLDENVSLEMYYCLQILRMNGAMTMTDFSKQIQIPKHQLSKMSNQMYEKGFIERIFDEKDRRIIRIKITDKAIQYMNDFLKKNTDCFQDLFDAMTEQDKKDFEVALNNLFRIFSTISYNEVHGKKS